MSEEGVFSIVTSYLRIAGARRKKSSDSGPINTTGVTWGRIQDLQQAERICHKESSGSSSKYLFRWGGYRCEAQCLHDGVVEGLGALRHLLIFARGIHAIREQHDERSRGRGRSRCLVPVKPVVTEAVC